MVSSLTRKRERCGSECLGIEAMKMWKSSAQVHRTNTTARQSLGGSQRRYAENNENLALAHVSDEKRSNEEERRRKKVDTML